MQTSYLIRTGSLHRWRNDPGGFCRISDHKKYGNVIGMSGEAVLAYKALLSDLG